MLSKPHAGWSNFQLEGTGKYELSYLDDIAFEWVEQAIHGLETLKPFCVKGFMEPGRCLCLVSYWNCHIICERDGREVQDGVGLSYSHTSMIDFCQYLYDDITENIDEWVSFVSYENFNFDEKKQRLESSLEKLKELIEKRTSYFNEHSYFL